MFASLGYGPRHRATLQRKRRTRSASDLRVDEFNGDDVAVERWDEAAEVGAGVGAPEGEQE